MNRRQQHRFQLPLDTPVSHRRNVPVLGWYNPRHAGLRVDGEYRLGEKHGGRDAARNGDPGPRRRPDLEGSDGPGRTGVRCRRSGLRKGDRSGRRIDRPEAPGGDRLLRSFVARTTGKDHPSRDLRSDEGGDRPDRTGGTPCGRGGGDPDPRIGEERAVRGGDLGHVRPGNGDLPACRPRRDVSRSGRGEAPGADGRRPKGRSLRLRDRHLRNLDSNASAGRCARGGTAWGTGVT